MSDPLPPGFQDGGYPNPGDPAQRSLVKAVYWLQKLASADDDTLTSVITARGSLLDAATLSLSANNTSQQVFESNSNRKAFFFQNISDIDLWINFGANATADTPSILVEPGKYFVFKNFIDTRAINVIGATAGKKFVAKEA